MSFNVDDYKVGIIGLGYVGLPLAVEFGKKIKTLGFDINSQRIKELSAGNDFTLECTAEELAQAEYLQYSCKAEDLANCNVFIVTVPTPIDEYKQPDLTPLVKASETLGKIIKKGDIVIYESVMTPTY